MGTIWNLGCYSKELLNKNKHDSNNNTPAKTPPLAPRETQLWHWECGQGEVFWLFYPEWVTELHFHFVLVRQAQLCLLFWI